MVSNNRFKRSRVSSSLSLRGKSMIGINQLRFAPAQPRSAQLGGVSEKASQKSGLCRAK